MSAVAAYRDDGPLAAWVGRMLIAAGVLRPRAHPLGWVVPALLRLLEYGSLVALAAVADPAALPVAFALVAVLAFHHYDIVYRLRHQRLEPPSWLRAAGGGWEGRLLVASLLALAGGLRYGYLVAAVALALLYASESASSWIRFSRGEGPVPHGDEDEDGD